MKKASDHTHTKQKAAKRVRSTDSVHCGALRNVGGRASSAIADRIASRTSL